MEETKNSFEGDRCCTECNAAVLQTLVRDFTGGRLSHSLLLEGETGCGKKTMALQLAAAILCKNPGEPPPCGHCAACRMALENRHPDLMLYSGKGKSRSFGVDQVREIRSSAFVLPNEGAVKVYILADVQEMTQEAQNAFLKILEEPPSHVVFILTCNNRKALLETVLSRVKCYTLSNPPVDQCVRILSPRYPGTSAEELGRLAWYFDGNIGQTIAALEDPSLGKTVLQVGELLLTAAGGSEYDLLLALSGFEKSKPLFQALLSRIDLLMVRLLLFMDRACEDPYGVLAPLSRKITRLQAVKIADIMKETTRNLEQNLNFSLLLTWFVSNLKDIFSQ